MRPWGTWRLWDSEAFCQKSIHCLKLSQPCFFAGHFLVFLFVDLFGFKTFTLYCILYKSLTKNKKQPKHQHFSHFSFGCSVSTAVSVSEIQTQHILGHKMWEIFKIRIRNTPTKPWDLSPPWKNPSKVCFFGSKVCFRLEESRYLGSKVCFKLLGPRCVS